MVSWAFVLIAISVCGVSFLLFHCVFISCVAFCCCRAFEVGLAADYFTISYIIFTWAGCLADLLSVIIFVNTCRASALALFAAVTVDERILLRAGVGVAVGLGAVLHEVPVALVYTLEVSVISSLI